MIDVVLPEFVRLVTGDIARVTVDVSGEPFVHEEAEMDRIIARE